MTEHNQRIPFVDPGAGGVIPSGRVYAKIRDQLGYSISVGSQRISTATGLLNGWNVSGEDMAAWQPCRVEKPRVPWLATSANDSYKFQNQFQVFPLTNANDQVIGAMQGPAPIGMSGPVIVVGLATCLVNVGDTGHEYCKPNDQKQLVSTPAQTQIRLMDAPTTGVDTVCKVLFGAGGGAGFPVELEQTGGAQGTGTSPATWTYTVRLEGSSDELATNVNPEDFFLPGVPGRHIGRMTAANKGWAHYNEAGALELDYINEWIETKVCEPPPGGPDS